MHSAHCNSVAGASAPREIYSQKRCDTLNRNETQGENGENHVRKAQNQIYIEIGKLHFYLSSACNLFELKDCGALLGDRGLQ